MESVSIANISEDQIESLVNNKNSGIEFEYALFYKLLKDDEHRNTFKKRVIDRHPKKSRILDIIARSDIQSLLDRLSSRSFSYRDIFIASQDDSVGPSDIILESEDSDFLGLSVKYMNTCTLNITSRGFLTPPSIQKGYLLLDEACNNYISECSVKYGHASNWFRSRKRSKHTDEFNSDLVSLVISDWLGKTIDDRAELLNKLIHADPLIDYWVVKFRKNRTGYPIDIDTDPIKYIDPTRVTLTQESSCQVGFRVDGLLFGKMQVKFNNGILEKPKGESYDYIVDGTMMVKGDPFGSWNFNLIDNGSQVDRVSTDLKIT
jgi:hypothetical protein